MSFRMFDRGAKLDYLLIMTREIILLTGPVEAPHLTDELESTGADLSILHAPNRRQLESAVLSAPPNDGRVLIAYCTEIIVPAPVLGTLGNWAYNFHPGPPTRPGVASAHFAVHEGDTRFGVTAHVMTERVDAGPIVGVKWFDVPNKTTVTELEETAYVQLFHLFCKLARALATAPTPLAHLDITWSGQAKTRKDVERMRAEDPYF